MAEERGNEPMDVDVPVVSEPEKEGPKFRHIYESLMVDCAKSISVAVTTRDDKCYSRAIRRLPKLRRNVLPEVLQSYCTKFQVFADSPNLRSQFEQIIDQAVQDGYWKAIADEEIRIAEAEAKAKEPKKKVPLVDDTKDKQTDKEKGKEKKEDEQEIKTTDKKSKTEPNTKIEEIKKKKKEEQKPEEPPMTLDQLFDHVSQDSHPQILLWLNILAVVFAIDSAEMKKLSAGKKDDERIRQIIPLATRMVDLLASPSLARVSDVTYSKVLFYFARPFDILGEGLQIVDDLILHYRKAALGHNSLSKATAINLILKIYLESNMWDPALKFISKAVFPADLRGPAQEARYLFFMGRLQALSLEYSDAYEKTTHALLKLAPSKTYGRGFKLLAIKQAVVVEMLKGDIPKKSIFTQNGPSLHPYEQLVQAVREGDLTSFRNVIASFGHVFEKDGLLHLVERLQHSVIRCGLRRLTTSYSRITLEEVAIKLGLDSAADAEGVVARAIADQIIEATIENNCLNSVPSVNVYTTSEPAAAFHRRTVLVQNLCQEAVKARQFQSGDDHAQRDAEAERRRQEQLDRNDEEADFGDDLDLL